jgi:hypothetical protein
MKDSSFAALRERSEARWRGGRGEERRERRGEEGEEKGRIVLTDELCLHNF